MLSACRENLASNRGTFSQVAAVEDAISQAAFIMDGRENDLRKVSPRRAASPGWKTCHLPAIQPLCCELVFRSMHRRGTFGELPPE